MRLAPTRWGVALVLFSLMTVHPRHATADPARWNVPTPTWGGKQFWTDIRCRGGYRVQHNVISGHFRVIDGGNIRRAWGNRQVCLTYYNDAVANMPTDRRPLIILLHGLMRTDACMKSMQIAFERRFPNAEVIRFGYASTHGSIGQVARALDEVVSDHGEPDSIHVVGHSMGNIVARRWIGDLRRRGDAASLGRLDRVASMVMLGPPNRGAAIARRLGRLAPFYWLTGPGGHELGRGWDDFESSLAIPPCPFWIVAGDRSETTLQNPLVDGPSDWVVSVEEATLPGAREILTVDKLHSFLMRDPKLIDWTVVKTGTTLATEPIGSLEAASEDSAR